MPVPWPVGALHTIVVVLKVRKVSKRKRKTGIM